MLRIGNLKLARENAKIYCLTTLGCFVNSKGEFKTCLKNFFLKLVLNTEPKKQELIRSHFGNFSKSHFYWHF